MVTTSATYRQVTKDITKSLDNTLKQPQVERETEYYKANIGNIKTIDDFVGDQRIYNYALKAFGLEDQIFAKAFIRKVLTEGIAKDDAFANRLTDKRFREFAEAFNFESFGETTTTFTRTQQGTVDRYVRQTLENQVGEQSPGARLALYFQRNVASITSPLSLLADPALLKVTQTALQLPTDSGRLDIDRQAALIAEKLDVKDLQDPAKLTKFLERFTTIYEINNPSTTSQAPILQILQPIESTISADLLSSIQNLRSNRR